MTARFEDRPAGTGFVTGPLDRPLPAAVAVGSNRWWLSYRNYPVFSAAWTLRRAALFSIIVALWGALSGLAGMTRGGSVADAVALFGYFFIGMSLIINAGPVLASIVRHQVQHPRLERALVVVAIVTGLGIALLVDQWSSSNIERLAGPTSDHQLSDRAIVFNLVVLFGIYAFIGGGLALRAYLSEGRRLAAFESARAMEALRGEKLAADQRLELLQAQIEPHFLFNTLSTVRSSIREEPEHAESTLDALCDYLRATIPRLRGLDDSDQVQLGEQLEVCRHYLTVMQKRMRERLEFSVEADDEARSRPFPPFVLLSLVENAIRHGLEPSPSGGRIDIRARSDTDRLTVEVSDTGVGLGDTVGSGVGLSNIREQLRLRFGHHARLSLEASPGEGVRARITVPLESVE